MLSPPQGGLKQPTSFRTCNLRVNAVSAARWIETKFLKCEKIRFKVNAVSAARWIETKRQNLRFNFRFMVNAVSAARWIETIYLEDRLPLLLLC